MKYQPNYEQQNLETKQMVAFAAKRWTRFIVNTELRVAFAGFRKPQAPLRFVAFEPVAGNIKTVIAGVQLVQHHFVHALQRQRKSWDSDCQRRHQKPSSFEEILPLLYNRKECFSFLRQKRLELSICLSQRTRAGFPEFRINPSKVATRHAPSVRAHLEPAMSSLDSHVCQSKSKLKRMKCRPWPQPLDHELERRSAKAAT